MSGKRKPYAPSFRQKLVELANNGRSVGELSDEFGPSEQAIRNWIAQDERDSGKGDGGLTTREREEIARLRKEIRVLQQERDILAKAAAWFARETKSVPEKGSTSS